jgi:predicted RNA-binding protein YlxR (DUF448 family)
MRTRHNEDALTPDISEGPVRSCVLTRERAEQRHLVRLALSPDGAVLPDVRARAPGRGAWIGVTRAELEAAIAKGRLRGALSRAFKTGDLDIPADLPARIEAALERNVLDRLGLESRAGALLTGAERIETAARTGKVHALYHAADAREDGTRRLAQAWRVGSDREGSDLKGLVLPTSRPILSMALGRENVVHIAVIDRAAAKRLGEALTRWLHFVGPDPVCQSCGTAPQGASAPGTPGHEPAVDAFEESE